MKKRILTLLLAASPLKAKAEPLRLRLDTPRRPPAGAAKPRTANLTVGGPSAEVPASPRQISNETVRQVFAARVAEPAPARTDAVTDLPPSMFVLDKTEKPQKRHVSVLPASFMAGGKGLKVKIPF